MTIADKDQAAAPVKSLHFRDPLTGGFAVIEQGDGAHKSLNADRGDLDILAGAVSQPLEKGAVKAHQRRSKTGKIINVHAYENHGSGHAPIFLAMKHAIPSPFELGRPYKAKMKFHGTTKEFWPYMKSRSKAVFIRRVVWFGIGGKANGTPYIKETRLTPDGNMVDLDSMGNIETAYHKELRSGKISAKFKKQYPDLAAGIAQMGKSLTFSGHPLMGKTTYQGLPISVENSAGSFREGIDPDGKPWKSMLRQDYGYIRGTVANDGDHVDCFIGVHLDSPMVYIIHQQKIKKPGRFDEDKIMLGWLTKTEALKDYFSNYDRKDQFWSMTEMSMDEFKKKIFDPKFKGRMLKAHIKQHIRQLSNGRKVVVHAHEDGRRVWFHGSPSGDLRGGATGLHIGTKQAAKEALEARIGIPADGKGWRGKEEYGKTLLAGKKTLKAKKMNVTGYNCDAPEDDYYPKKALKYADGSEMPMTVKPSVKAFFLTGEMSNSPSTPHQDFKANGYMAAQKKKGTARRGYYYRNEGEDYGSISATVPNGDHLQPVKKSMIKAHIKTYTRRSKTGKLSTVKEHEDSRSKKANFKKWFKNSKVVDAKGKPLVVYHGTGEDFHTFDRERSIGGQYWFTSNKKGIEDGEVGAQGKGVIMEVYLSLQNPAGWDDYHNLTIGELIGRGFDGLMLPDGENETTYVAFHPWQIKSATRNNGNYSSDTGNMRKAVIKQHTRRSKTGKVSTVKQHTDSRNSSGAVYEGRTSVPRYVKTGLSNIDPKTLGRAESIGGIKAMDAFSAAGVHSLPGSAFRLGIKEGELVIEYTASGRSTIRARQKKDPEYGAKVSRVFRDHFRKYYAEAGERAAQDKFMRWAKNNKAAMAERKPLWKAGDKKGLAAWEVKWKADMAKWEPSEKAVAERVRATWEQAHDQVPIHGTPSSNYPRAIFQAVKTFMNAEFKPEAGGKDMFTQAQLMRALFNDNSTAHDSWDYLEGLVMKKVRKTGKPLLVVEPKGDYKGGTHAEIHAKVGNIHISHTRNPISNGRKMEYFRENGDGTLTETDGYQPDTKEAHRVFSAWMNNNDVVLKSHIKQHERRSANGKVSVVHDYDDKRSKKEAPEPEQKPGMVYSEAGWLPRDLQLKTQRGMAGEGVEIKLTEEEVDTLLKHSRVGMVSAGRNPAHPKDKALSDDAIKRRTNRLRADLVKGGFKFVRVKGHYEGEEESFMVMIPNISEKELTGLGTKYRQDSVIFTEGGKNKLIYTYGENKGKFHPGNGFEYKPKAKDYYTEIETDKGIKKFSLNLDFSKLVKALIFRLFRKDKS